MQRDVLLMGTNRNVCFFPTDNKEAVLMIIDRNIPMVDDALKELDEVGYFMLCRPPSGTFKTFKNLYFG